MSQQVIGELPINAATYEDYLRLPGVLSGNVTMKDATKNRDLLDAGRRAVYVMRNGVIEWGGLMLTPTVPLGAEIVQVRCVGWLGWFDARDIWTDRQFPTTDQFLIFRTLVADSQDVGVLGAGADLGITVDYGALSGVLRDRLQEYRYFAGKNLGAAMRELAALENGFDYRMRYRVSDAGDKIEKAILLSYPNQGIDYSGSRNAFEYEAGQRTNILQRGVSFDASGMRWRIRGWGAGSDVSRLLSTQVDDSLRGVYPFFDGQGSFSSIVTQSVLDDNTRAVLGTKGHVAVIPSTVVDPKLDPKWGTYGIGDTFNVDIVDGFASASGAHRLIGYKMDVATDRPTLYWQAT